MLPQKGLTQCQVLSHLVSGYHTLGDTLLHLFLPCCIYFFPFSFGTLKMWLVVCCLSPRCLPSTGLS